MQGVICHVNLKVIADSHHPCWEKAGAWLYNAASPFHQDCTMQHEPFWLDAEDTQLFVHYWHNRRAPKAVVMIAHGMAEHAARYERLAQALVEAGYAVYAHDQRGHGRSIKEGVPGHFADADGWHKLVRDLSRLNHHICQQHPHTPIFLFGHSMGSYVAQAYLMQHSCSLQGAVLSGSNYQPPALYRSAALIARFERWRQGPRGRSALIERLSFGSFNKAFKPSRTDFDWLSRDPQEVQNYISDPLCGFRCTNQFWLDLLQGLQQISSPKKLAQIDDQLPLLIIGGAHDPVSQGKRLEDLARILRQAGSRHLSLKIYPEARHELLNDSNRDEVTAHLITWLDQTLASPPQKTFKEPE
jgi:alpha-beta hydrolase superfamily lysophospholipase